LTPQAVPEDLRAAVKAAAAQIDSYLKSVGREVQFRVDDDTGMTVVTVRATATGDVIRQIPNEEVLQLARSLKSGSGALLDLVV
jgi:flagellar protein FlaG